MIEENHYASLCLHGIDFTAIHGKKKKNIDSNKKKGRIKVATSKAQM